MCHDGLSTGPPGMGRHTADLISLPFREYDLILGMDWLSKHQAIVDCDK